MKLHLHSIASFSSVVYTLYMDMAEVDMFLLIRIIHQQITAANGSSQAIYHMLTGVIS